MKDKKGKLKEKSMICKANAYSYLFAILELSDDFKNKIDGLRRKFEVEKYSKIPPKEEDFKKAIKRAKYLADNQDTDLTGKKDFIDLCDDFFIPKILVDMVNKFVVRGEKASFLKNKIQFSISGDGSPVKTPKLNVPHIIVSIPYDTKIKDFDRLWENKQYVLDELGQRFFKGAKNWRDGESFDKAFIAYRAMIDGAKGRQVAQKLKDAKCIEKASQLWDGRNDQYIWFKEIEKQVNSLAKYAKEFL